MLNIAGVSVGHDVGDPCLGGRLDELAVCVAGRSGGDSNNKELLAFEGIDNGGLIAVVDGGDNDALGEFVGAVFARERAVTVCFPVLRRAAARKEPTVPPA